MGERGGRVPLGAEAFRVQQRPIVLGEPPHSHFHEITPEAIATEAIRILDTKEKNELILGLKPEVIAIVASQVSHMGFRFQEVTAAIIEDQLHLSGKIKKGPVTLFKGQIIVGNGSAGLEIIDGSLGPLTRLVRGFNGFIASQMGDSLGCGFSVGQIRITTPQSTPGIRESVLTARVARQQPFRRAA